MVRVIDIGMYNNYMYIYVANAEQEKLENKQIRPKIIYHYILLRFSSYFIGILSLGRKLFSRYRQKP